MLALFIEGRLRLRLIRLYLPIFLAEKSKKKDKKKSIGEMQLSTKCQIEPSNVEVKLECKDWPLLFKVVYLSGTHDAVMRHVI